MPTPPPPKPLCPPATSVVTDPNLQSTVERDYGKAPTATPTNGPNRLTFRVPTEKTTLSLGAPSSERGTDTGITGFSESHVHFEVTKNDMTVVTLGTAATAAKGSSWDKKAPTIFDGYAMVTAVNAWHEAEGSQYLLSQKEDISLRAAAAGKRAVVQSDDGGVDVNAKIRANFTASGVAIVAGELEIEKPAYTVAWEGKRPDSAAGTRANLASAVTGAMSAIVDIVYSVPRDRFSPGSYAASSPSIWDKGKRVISTGLGILAGVKVALAANPKVAPPGCVTLSAPEAIGVAAGGDVSIWGALTAGIGSTGWTTVSAAVSASLKAVGFASVAGMYTSIKGYKKVEVGSDLGMVFVGAQEKIEMEAGADFTAAPGKAAAVSSPEGEVHFGAEEKVWLGSPAGTGFGLLLEEGGLDFGKANISADNVDANKINVNHAVHITKDKIELYRKDKNSKIELSASELTVLASQKKIDITASSGTCTLNGSKVLLN